MIHGKLQNKRVTWLLPVRNGMPFLPRTLQSIASQSFKHAQIIAWDNGSTDDTAKVLKEWIPSRIPGVVVTGQALGLGASLAAMVNMATSHYCARIDADDINLPDRLAQQVAFMDRHPAVAVVGSAMKLIGEKEESLGDGAPPACHDADIRWRLRFCNALSHPTVMFRRGAILAAGNYADIMPIEDYELWVRVAERFPIANLPQQLLKYRMTTSSVSGKNRHHINTIRRRVIEDHRQSLFGIDDRAIVARLLDLLTTPGPHDVTLHDIRQLRHAATLAATQAGQDAHYFRQTALYQRQQRMLTTSWARTIPGIKSLWPLLRSVVSARPMKTSTAASAPSATSSIFGFSKAA